MINYPEFVKIGDKKYKINTDFKVALKCEEISKDENIEDYERALAIIYKLFGDAGLEDFDNHEKLLELAFKYLSRGKEEKSKKGKIEKPDMDFIQDYPYIKASFRSDYNIDLDNTSMHFWEFFDLLSGLSNSEFGNCCILNRIRNLRNIDLKTIKDPKERQEIREAQEMFALKKEKRKLSEEQQKNVNDFLKLLGEEK